MLFRSRSSMTTSRGWPDGGATTKPRTAKPGEMLWRFESRGGLEKVTPLWLYPELDCSSCVDGADDQSGMGQLAYYARYLKSRHPDVWASDAVRIYWYVEGNGGILESAPTNPTRNFLTLYTLPVDAETGERLNWWRLPVRNTRFPKLADALGWLRPRF